MCDWEAEEFAEYLLWADAEKARAQVRARTPVEASSPSRSPSAELPREVAEA